MELNKFTDFCITLRDTVVVEKASRFVHPIIPIGFVCNKRGIKYRIIKKSHSGETVSFSDISLSEGESNICYMFFKNKSLKTQMITNLIEMFDAGSVYIRIIIPFGVCEKDYLKDVEFKPIFARYIALKVLVSGKRLKRVTKRERFCFDSFVKLEDLYLDVDLLESTADIGQGVGSVKMDITKKQSNKLLSDEILNLDSNSFDD